jgi:hypothetical protein
MASKKERKAAAALLGSRGGKASRARMTPEQASELGRKAVNARWKKWRAAKALTQIEDSLRNSPVVSMERIGKAAKS